jgi:hypothetical protein
LHPSQKTIAFEFSPSPSSHIAHLESSTGRWEAGWGILLICTHQSRSPDKGWRIDKLEPLFLKAVHHDLKNLIRDIPTLLLLPLGVDSVEPSLV